MLALIQLVKHAKVEVDAQIVGQINRGLLVFIAMQNGDDKTRLENLLSRVLKYRIFPDADGKMNLSVQDVQGGLLLVPQFTLAADTKKGLRPSFSTALDPKLAKSLFAYAVDYTKKIYVKNRVAQGEFSAHMQVTLCNDGPETFLLHS